jgi:hypothetical protein
MQHRALEIKIYISVIVAGEINLLLKHCCATVIVVFSLQE